MHEAGVMLQTLTASETAAAAKTTASISNNIATKIPMSVYTIWM